MSTMKRIKFVISFSGSNGVVTRECFIAIHQEKRRRGGELILRESGRGLRSILLTIKMIIMQGMLTSKRKGKGRGCTVE